jgi:hypothetical protein
LALCLTRFVPSAEGSITNIAPGQIVAGSITNAGQTNYYTFTAASNDVISVALLRTNGSGRPYLVPL